MKLRSASKSKVNIVPEANLALRAKWKRGGLLQQLAAYNDVPAVFVGCNASGMLPEKIVRAGLGPHRAPANSPEWTAMAGRLPLCLAVSDCSNLGQCGSPITFVSL